DHVLDVEDATVVEHGQTVLDSDHPRMDALDPGADQILLSVAQERSAAVPDVRPHLAAERRVHCEDVRAEEEEDAKADAPSPRLDRCRDLTRVRSRQDGAVIDSCLVGDIGSRVARADHENAALLKLRKVAIVVRMQLPDLRVELWREA